VYIHIHTSYLLSKFSREEKFYFTEKIERILYWGKEKRNIMNMCAYVYHLYASIYTHSVPIDSSLSSLQADRKADGQTGQTRQSQTAKGRSIESGRTKENAFDSTYKHNFPKTAK
jgi:hypothetical protein